MEPAMFFPVVLGLVALVWVVLSRKKLARAKAESADQALGAVANRLGLTLLEGDPNLNLLYFQQPSGDFQRNIRMAGQPYGRQVTLWLADGQKTSEFIVARKITQSFGCVLEASLSVPCAPFEVVLREPNQYLVPHQEFAERTELAPATIGNPVLDQHFVVRAADPRIAPVLASALNLLSTHLFVHLAGEGQRVWMSITRMGLPYVAHAAEEYLLALETAACALEGRPAPAQLAPIAQNSALAGAPPAGAP